MDTRKGSDLQFADNYISYIMESDTMSFNIFGVADKASTPLSQRISHVSFPNQNIQIVNFQVNSGSIDDHELFNIIVEVELVGNGIEKETRLDVQFDNGEILSYDIGDITLSKISDEQNEVIAHNKEYIVAYPFPSLDMTIRNKEDDEIILDEISDPNKTIRYSFPQNTKVEKQGTHSISIPSFEMEDYFDFYTISPVLQYHVQNKKSTYVLPGVMYYTLLSDEEKIQRILY